MTGVSSDLLAPDAVFTWAQAVQSTYALEGCPTLSSSVKFADAAPADWFASAVNCAAANAKALINGTSITFLTPASSTTSVQMPVILMRFCEGIAG